MNHFKIVTALSLLRIFIIPVLLFIAIYFEPGIQTTVILFVLVNVAFITDFLDGYIARKYDCSTAIGALLDLLGDKLLVTFLLIYALFFNKLGIIVVLLLLIREVLSMVFRYLKNQKSGGTISPSIIGKSKTALQFIAFDLMFLTDNIYKVLFWIIIVISYYSLFSYFKILRKEY